MNNRMVIINKIFRFTTLATLIISFFPVGIAQAAPMNTLALDTAPVGVGKYNDTDSNIVYSGAWVAWNGAGYPLDNNDEHYTSQVGASATLVFSGQGISIGFLGAPTNGTVQIMIDGSVMATVSTYRTSYQAIRWDSESLASGSHTVVVRHNSGAYTEFDYMEVVGPQAAVAKSKYNDTDGKIVYSGGWIPWTGAGYPLYNNDEHYTSKVGASATLVFDGVGISIGFLGAPTNGTAQIMIDGSVMATVSTYRTSYQAIRWDSGALANGSHTVVVKHNSGTYTEFDYMEVTSGLPEDEPTPTPSPTNPPQTPSTGEGMYDDTENLFAYNGDWKTYAYLVGGPYEGDGHYSTTPGNSATIKFTGSGVTLVYTGANNRGIMDILVDDQVVATLDQKADSLQWQQQWWLNNASWSSGEHTLVLKHTSGEVVDIDAIMIGKHDYCTSSSQSADREGIIRVQLESGDKSSARTPYIDNPDVFTNLNQGSTYTINITAEKVNSDPYAVFGKVWIDFNNDGNFEALTTSEDEGMMQFFNGTYVFSKTFEVPTGLTPGNVKMRVIIRADNIPDACGQYNYGATEDFLVGIQ